MLSCEDNSLITKRWLNAIFVTAIAIVICFTVSPLIFDLSGMLLRVTAGKHIIFYYTFHALIVGALCLVIIKLKGLPSLKTYRAWLRFPPIWVFGILGLLAFLYLLRDHPATVQQAIPMHHAIGSILAGIALSVLYLPFLHRSAVPVTAPPHAPSPSIERITDDWYSMKQWIANETPILTPMEDAYTFAPRAKRLAGLIQSGDLKSIGVLGRFGSGKSSFINLLIHHLIGADNAHQFVVCKIEAWGRAEGSLTHQILSAAIDDLSNHVDCSSIATVPYAYKSLMENSGVSSLMLVSILLSTMSAPLALSTP